MLVIGHRGAAAVAPENTVAGVERAFADRADAVEVDVRLTLDGHLVVIHDASLERTTGVAGVVEEIPLHVLRATDAGDGRPIPTLAEIWEASEGKLIVEVKAEWGSPVASRTVEALVPFLLARDCSGAVVSSFDVVALALLRTSPAGEVVRTGVLTVPAFDAASNISAAVEGGHAVCFLPDTCADAAAVAAAHAAGRSVVAWTVNDAGRLLALRNNGGDGVITDDPAAARAILDGSAP